MKQSGQYYTRGEIMLKTRQGRVRYTETLEELLREGSNRMPESQHDRKPGDGLIKLDNIDFRGADLRKARLNLSNFNNCKFAGADLRGIRGKYAIWRGSDWWNATLDESLEKALKKKWPKPSDD